MLYRQEAVAASILMRENPVLYAAMTYHRTHKGEPLDFARYPYMKQIYADKSLIVGAMKSTQCGVSEYILNREIAEAMQGYNVFHVLPTDNLISRFVRERFDKTIQAVPRYQKIMKESRGASTVTLKQIGKGTIALVGSNSTSSFTEFPADDGIIDENDQCDQENIIMVDDRLANSRKRSRFTCGNPTLVDFGIHALYKDSKAWLWHVRCPACNQWVHPSFLDHVVVQENETQWTYRDREWTPETEREPRMIHTCGGTIDPHTDGIWIAQHPGKKESFYHIGKEFSTRVSISDLCKKFSKALDDETVMMKFYNSDLGLPYTPKGSKLDISEL
jgi:phage terminase large subunit GpA-like protein